MGAELFHAAKRVDGQQDGLTEGQADMTTLIVAFRNFASAPKKKGLVTYNKGWTIPNFKSLFLIFVQYMK